MDKNTVDITSSGILINGQQRQIISGAMHYFRSLPGQWDDLMAKAKAFGLDAIETYFCWNLHEPEPGKFDFSGRLDFVKFLQAVQRHGLFVIVRPGPYICAEWNNGGFPEWLNSVPGIKMRRDNPAYMDAVTRYFDELLPRIADFQYTRNGNVILAAVENEYGSYGCDKRYLEKLRQMFLHHGFDIPLITVDGAHPAQFLGGMLENCTTTITQGAGWECLKNFQTKRSIRPDDPDLCMEYWCGTFDRWGQKHRTTSAVDCEIEFDRMLAVGASVNIYMFHGGTNFGFTSGASMFYGGVGEHGVDYVPFTTSYDYNALLDESGDITPLYKRLHKILKKYRPGISALGIKSQKKEVYPDVAWDGVAPMFDHLDEIGTTQCSSFPLPLNPVDGQTGYMLYRTKLRGPMGCGEEYAGISLWNLKDRAQLFLNGDCRGILERNRPWEAVPVQIHDDSAQLDVLVESLGYVMFGPAAGTDIKGVEEVLLGGSGVKGFVMNFECVSLPMNNLDNLTFESMHPILENKPAFYHAEFMIETPENTYLKYPGRKGFVVVNGFNIGRYWDIGPGDVLIIPKELLRVGRNEIIVFEQHRIKPLLEFSDTRNWDSTE